MQNYLDLLSKVLSEGTIKSDRTGTGTRSLFGESLYFDLNTFPLLTTKKIHFKSVAHELLWFLKGTGNTKYLKDNKIKIWDEWASIDGDLGPVYGVQWRSWDGIDQITEVIHNLKHNPDSRRHIVSAWNVGQLHRMALPPCHVMFQFYVADNELSCQIYQRSADIFLGLPFNIASYALLTSMVAHVTGYNRGRLVHILGDVHLYRNHEEQALKQLSRKPTTPPTLTINPNITNIDDFTIGDFQVVDYNPQSLIKAKVAI